MAEVEVPTLFIKEPSQHLTCPVCQKLYTQPVINIACGHTFCKECAESISKCPVDGNECMGGQMVVNRLVVGQIEDLLVYCTYGLTKEGDKYVPDPSGCQLHINFGSRDEHESECDFKPIRCSNKHCTSSLRKNELEDHLKVCLHFSCIHEDKGCEFQGQQAEVEEHLISCTYRSLQKSEQSSEFVEQRTQVLEQCNKDLQKQVTTLNLRVGQLEEVNTSLQGQLSECLSILKDVQKKYDGLASSVEQLLTVRNRRSFGSPSNHGDGRPRSSSSSSFRKSISGSPPRTSKMERWQMPFSFKCLGTLRGHQDIVWCMASRNKKLYTAGADSCIKVWDLDNLERGCIKTIQGQTKVIQCMCIDSGYLYTGGNDNAIYCWSLDDYEIVRKLEAAHDNIICAMAIVGNYLFTSSFGLIKVWEAKTLKQKHQMPGLHHWVRALALNPERDKLYSGSHNTIDVWSVNEPFGLKGKVDHQYGSVYSLVITSKYIIAGTYNRNIHLFNVNTYESINALKGHIGVITGVSVSGCEGFCCSCSSDGTIKIWNLENMLPIQTLQRHEGSVNALVVHGDFLFSGSEDHEIKVFRYFQMQMGFNVNT